MCNTNSKLGSLICDSDTTVMRILAHVDYPHAPGAYGDCDACESACHCDPDNVVTMGDERDMCVHCENESGVYDNEDGDESDDFGPYENHGFEHDFDFMTEY